MCRHIVKKMDVNEKVRVQKSKTNALIRSRAAARDYGPSVVASSLPSPQRSSPPGYVVVDRESGSARCSLLMFVVHSRLFKCNGRPKYTRNRVEKSHCEVFFKLLRNSSAFSRRKKDRHVVRQQLCSCSCRAQSLGTAGYWVRSPVEWRTYW